MPALFVHIWCLLFLSFFLVSGKQDWELSRVIIMLYRYLPFWVEWGQGVFNEDGLAGDQVGRGHVGVWGTSEIEIIRVF